MFKNSIHHDVHKMLICELIQEKLIVAPVKNYINRGFCRHKVQITGSHASFRHHDVPNMLICE